MYPESNQIGLTIEEKCSSSSETISADRISVTVDQQTSNDSDFVSDEDEFVDTQDDFFEQEPTFEEALLDCRRAIAVFFNNDFNEAIRICDRWKDVSPIHAITGLLFNSYFTFFTLEKDAIENTRTKLRDAEFLLSQIRKQQNFSKYFFKANYHEFTEEQLYYEFLQALMLLISFFLTLLCEPSILSIIKCAFKLKSTNSILRNCEEIIKQKENNWSNDLIKNELERGYNYINGGLNILFSHLPSKVLSVLAIMGFSGDRKKGIEGLQKGFEDKTSLFWQFSGIAIMTYNLYAEHILGFGLSDTTWSWKCIKDIISRYPNSLVTFQFIARAYLVTGDPEKAKDYFIKVIESKTLKCNSLLNLCNWDLIWAHSLMGDFLKAAEIALYLKANCNWSPATNQYQAAVFLYTHSLKTCDKKLMDRSLELMKDVKNLRNRYAGKTIPWEKFVITKAEEFINNGYLVAPAYELFYIWNIISNIQGKDKYLNLIENDLNKQIAIKWKLIDQPNENLDELCLLLNLKGCVLRNKFEYKKSIECLRQIFKYEDRIVNYTYILPNACCDLGINYYLDDNLIEAKKYLHSARSNYTGYLAETMVHFKIHNTLLCIKSKELKISGSNESETVDQIETNLADQNEIEKIKIEIDRKKRVYLEETSSLDLEKANDSTTKLEKQLETVEEENNLNYQQDSSKQIFANKAYSLDYRSKSEASLIDFNEIKFKSNSIRKNLTEINNNQIINHKNYESNPQINRPNNLLIERHNRKVDNNLQLKELVDELGHFKERLMHKQRKNSILKRVKSLSKINFTKNLHNEVLKEELEFDLQKNQKLNKKKKIFKRRISGIF